MMTSIGRNFSPLFELIKHIVGFDEVYIYFILILYLNTTGCPLLIFTIVCLIRRTSIPDSVIFIDIIVPAALRPWS